VPSAADTGSLEIISPKISNPCDTRDPLAKLPAQGRARLLNLRDQCEELMAARHAQSDALMEIQTQKLAAAKMLQRVESELRLSVPAFKDAETYVAEHPAFVDAKAKHDRLQAECDRRKPRVDDLGERRQRLGRLLRACEDYSAEHKDLTAYVAPRRRKTDASVAELRDQLAALQLESAKIKAAPLPAADAKKAADRWIDELATQGALDVSSLIWHGAAPRIPQTRMQLFEVRPEVAGLAVMGNNELAIMAAFFPDMMKAKLAAWIDARADDSVALTVDAKAKKLDQLAAQILEIERDEVAAVEAAGGEYREDTDVRAFLMLA
jgi:hypothetical protein